MFNGIKISRFGNTILWVVQKVGISAKQAKIMAFPYSKYDCIICDGAVRSGKTSIMTVSFIRWAMDNFNGCRFGICGKTVDSAVKNIVVPYTQMSYANDRYLIRWRRSDKILEVRRGKTVNIFEVFGGKDEASASLIQGRTLAGVLLDEVVLMPRSFVEQALARCSVEGSRIWFSCNPASPSHWFYEEWILKKEEKNALYLHFSMTDNPSLSEKTLERYQKMYSGIFYQRYVLGEWVLAEGLVYPGFNKDKHCFSDPPFLDEKGIMKRSAECYISIDYGIVNPFAAHLWVVYDGVAYCWKEYYFDSRKKQRQLTDEEHYNAVEKLAGENIIQNIIIDPSATSFKETVRRHDKFSCQNAKNDVINGISTFSTLLENDMIKIHESCESGISEFGLYSWDPDAKEETVIKENDHAMDSYRYFAYTILRKEFYWMNWGDDD